MKKTFLKPALLAATFALLTACSNDELEFDQHIDVTIQGVTFNSNGNETLQDVAVSLVGDESTVTGEDGSYQFTDKEGGSHLLRFEKDGYSTMIQELFVDATDFTAKELTSSTLIELYENTTSVSTSFKINDGFETTDAVGAAVTIEPISGVSGLYFENDKIETTTDSNGEISVNGLPDVSLLISVELADGDFLYTTTVGSFADDLEKSYTLTRTSILEDLVLVNTNLIENALSVDDFTSTDNITFTFSDDLNTDFQGFSAVLLKEGLISDEVVIETSIAGNVLTIDPLGTDLEAGASYELSISVESTEGQSFDGTYGFTVEGVATTLGQVVGLELDEVHSDGGTSTVDTSIQETDTSITIQFDEVEGATSYEVYGAYSGASNEYILLTAFSTSDSDDEIERVVNLTTSDIEVPTDGYFDGESWDIIVRAVSGNSFGQFSPILTVEEGDEN